MNEIIGYIGSLGFPIVACIYMATTNNKSIEKLTDSINENTKIISVLEKFISRKLED